MKRMISRFVFVLVAGAGSLVLSGSSRIEKPEAQAEAMFLDCYVAQKVVEFNDGRLNVTSLPIDVNVDGTWGAYVVGSAASWVRINGGGTISSGGHQQVTVSVVSPIPAGTPVAGFCGTETIGYIYFYFGCGGSQQVKVRYVRCPCC